MKFMITDMEEEGTRKIERRLGLKDLEKQLNKVGIRCKNSSDFAQLFQLIEELKQYEFLLSIELQNPFFVEDFCGCIKKGQVSRINVESNPHSLFIGEIFIVRRSWLQQVWYQDFKEDMWMTSKYIIRP